MIMLAGKWLLTHATNRNKMVIAGDFNTCYNVSASVSGINDKLSLNLWAKLDGHLLVCKS